MILNSNIKGDEEEEWTYSYIRARGQMIDYAVIEGESRDRIENLVIGDKVELDYQPITVKLKEKKERIE